MKQNVQDGAIQGESPERCDSYLLSTVLEFSSRIAEERNLSSLLCLVSDFARELVRAERVSVWLVDREFDELYTIKADRLDQIRIPLGTGLVGSAINQERALNSEDTSNDERFFPEIDRETGFHTSKVLVVPFRDNAGLVMGAFQAINKKIEEDSFTALDIQILQMVAVYAGKVLESALLNLELEQTQSTLLLKMGEVAESRSKDIGFHVKRVAEYSYILALEAGLSQDDANLLKLVSPMHDVGKVAIPDSILNKPGKLSPEDFELMKSHTQVGYEIFRECQGRVLTAAALVAWQHHEKWNGKGYPRGLAGENIHPFARITAVADVFDALASDRVYKKAWEIDKVMKLFEEERGQHFEPKMVDALKACLPKILEIREALRDPNPSDD